MSAAEDWALDGPALTYPHKSPHLYKSGTHFGGMQFVGVGGLYLFDWNPPCRGLVVPTTHSVLSTIKLGAFFTVEVMMVVYKVTRETETYLGS